MADFSGQLFIMLSNGGIMDVEFCSERGVELIQSGPSGGVIAAIRIGELPADRYDRGGYGRHQL